jgi:hypothetical protein
MTHSRLDWAGSIFNWEMVWLFDNGFRSSHQQDPRYVDIDNHLFLSIYLSTQQASYEATQPFPNLPASCCSILAQSFRRLTPFLPVGSGVGLNFLLSHGDRRNLNFPFLGQPLVVSFARVKICFTIASRTLELKSKSMRSNSVTVVRCGWKSSIAKHAERLRSCPPMYAMTDSNQLTGLPYFAYRLPVKHTRRI